MHHYTRIRDLREDKDLTQEALCKQIYMHKTTYTNYEQGKHTVPLDFAVLIADFYDVSLDYIAGRTNSPKENYGLKFSRDDLCVMKKFSMLTERNKGRVEQFLDQIYEQQEEKTLRKKEAE